MDSTNKSLHKSSSSKIKTEPKYLESDIDSSISLTYDSQTDYGYRSGEIQSPCTSTSECISDIDLNPNSQKLDQSGVFDSGLISDCFSPTSAENISFAKNEPESILPPTDKIKTKKKLESEDIFSQDKDGDTILHLAIVEAHSDIVFPLIQLAPHPDFLDITNDLFQTPLHLATFTGKSNIVRRLVVSGATLDIQDHNGNTPLHIASQRGDLDCVQSMLTPITQSEVLDAHCAYQIYLQEQDMSYLINKKNYDGLSCVHYAADRGFLQVMECLFLNHADMNNQEGKAGQTALHYAVESGNLNLVELLMYKCKANPNVRNYAGRSPLRTAYSICKRNQSRARKEILNVLKHQLDFQESPSDSESDVSSDEFEPDNLSRSSRSSSHQGC